MTSHSFLPIQPALPPGLLPSDIPVLADVHRLHVITGMQIQAIHHGEGDAAKQRRVRQLARLSKLKLLTRLARRVGGPGGGSYSGAYSLGTAGQRLIEPDRARPRKPWTPSSSHLRHALAVSQLYTDLRVAERDGSFELIEFAVEPTCWRSFADVQGRATLKPDAHVVTAADADELHWFVEVDMGTETRPRITNKCQLYADYWATGEEDAIHGVFPRVLWVVPEVTRASTVIEAIHKLDAADHPLFEAATFETAAEVLTGTVEGISP